MITYQLLINRAFIEQPAPMAQITHIYYLLSIKYIFIHKEYVYY